MACSHLNKILIGKIDQTIYSYNSISLAPLSEVSSLKIVYFETLVALPFYKHSSRLEISKVSSPDKRV